MAKTPAQTVADLLDETTELAKEGEYVELWARDQAQDIDEAARQGLTVERYRDQVDRAIAYVEDGYHAQDVFERGDPGLYDADEM